MRVFGARCIVREAKLDERTAGGIVIPGREKQSTNRGEVIAVGNGAMLDNGTRVPMDVKVGDTVIYTSFSGTPVVSEGKQAETLVILNERDVLAVLD